ncbi:nucleotidyltransferase family protein [Niallia oryzisoli]|uniref:Nucleotidyltransferase family protein n=1 Tax=Niallia oryzisoli TaxID=1737571 RepID=A0ABZ2CCQ9_9BACI
MSNKDGRQQISAIILAAGTSSRMGQPKQLLFLQGRPLLEHAIERAISQGFAEIITVVGCEAAKIKQSILVSDPRFRWVMNEEYEKGQGVSLKTGMVSVNQQSSGVMVFLGDLPFLAEQTVQSIFHAGMEMLTDCKESFVIQPEYNGITGHPVFFGHLDRSFIERLQGDRGGKAMMNKIACRRRFPVDDRGIIYDIDTPEIYEEAKKL